MIGRKNNLLLLHSLRLGQTIGKLVTGQQNKMLSTPGIPPQKNNNTTNQQKSNNKKSNTHTQRQNNTKNAQSDIYRPAFYSRKKNLKQMPTLTTLFCLPKSLILAMSSMEKMGASSLLIRDMLLAIRMVLKQLQCHSI